MTGLRVQDLLASTLLPIIRLLHPNPVVLRSSQLPWILPLGCRNRSHAGGLLCCPVCIMDPQPYFRQQYRLAWHTACPRHRALLIDRCPCCYSALQPGRIAAEHPLSNCHHCGCSLGSSSSEAAIESALAFQTFVDTASHSTAAYGGVSLSFSEWMSIARVMISFLKKATRHPTVTALRFCKAIGVDTSQLKSSSLGLPFEYATPAERAGLLGQAWVIMQAGPERFMELAADAELPVTAFPLPALGVPEIFKQMATAFSQHPPHKRGRSGPSHTRAPLEVWHMWNRLQRRMRRHDIS
ncbi:TniQ family protein [Pseudomonas sp. S32]|nr:TniQ family protein [Pseudomonas sp. S32]